MKKYLSLLLACVLTLALLCACGGKDAAEQTPRAGDTADADGRHRRRGHVLQALFPERRGR